MPLTKISGEVIQTPLNIGVVTATTVSTGNINATGIITATTFSGNISGVAATFTGNVSIAGTLTYEDVTNVDSIGIVTARSGVRIDAGGLVVTSGVSTFTSGPLLIGAATSTGTTSQPLQVTGGAYVSGNLGVGTTNPQALLQVGAATTQSVVVTSTGILGVGGTNTGSSSNKVQIITQGSAAEGLGIFGTWTSQGAEQGAINFYGANNASGALANIVNIDNRPTNVASRAGSLVFKTASGGPLFEALRIDSSQRVGIGTTNPQAPLHVVGTGQTALLVTGNARVTGILTVGTSSLTFDGNANTITGLSTITGSSNFSKPSFAGISSTITATAVDVFVYDTRKDSDGGAWRKRTQHTSWYNETLNTATRGSRRDFPAVAVIVATSSSVTIYDGDDPDMPMWMVFNQATNYIIYTTITSVYMLNGKLIVGTNPNAGDYYDGGIKVFDFISEFIRGYAWTNSPYFYGLNISQRNYSNNATAVALYGSSNGILVNTNVNDVAMTVLPNAPIDPATGLPVPTIAVATQGGISIITDSGTVYNLTPESDPAYANIKNFFSVGFDSNQKIFFTDTQTGSGYSQLIYLPNYNYNQSLSDNYSYLSGSYNYAWDSYIRIGVSQTGYWAPSNTVRLIKPSVATRDSIAIGYTGSGLGGDGLSLIGQQDNYLMNCGITTTFNTGWLYGYTQGAFLSDTSTASVTGTELVTNGTFASGTTGWSSSNSGALSVVSGALRINANGNAYGGAVQTLPTLVVGKTYVLSADIGTISNASAFTAIVRDSIGTLGATFPTSNQKTSIYFTARDASGTYVLFESPNDSDAICDIDNVSVRITEADRSVNNKGLAVYGTITKTAVATGADLVAYSGFSTSNYLHQPYNSALDFGTGDFCVMGWVKSSGGSNGYIWERAQTLVASAYTEMYWSNSNTLNFHINGGTPATQSVSPNVWNHFVALRSGGVQSLYVNGIRGTNVTNSGNLTNSNAQFRVGIRAYDVATPFNGSIALIRVGTTAPSPDQIKKIYNDEKVLFQENSKATLYGTSSAVTALAYDDSTRLLYAGTSSGRSDFQGLERINNTTTAVTTAISASNGLVAEQ